MSIQTSRAIQAGLSDWFASGHTRLTFVLEGAKLGRVLLAQPRSDGSGEIRLTERWIVEDSQSRITFRGEEDVSLAAFASDPDNGPRLEQAIQRRIAGEVAPPPVALKTRGPR